MAEFLKYMHLERYGTDAVLGVEEGTTYVFPKLDGTNGSIWVDDNGEVRAGSRNRVLSVGSDNAGFYNWLLSEDPEAEKHRDLLAGFPELVVYGEWLVPHTLKTYQDSAWRKFYIFDVWNKETNEWYHYDRYSGILDAYELNYLPPIAIVKNGTYEQYLKCLEKNVFLIKDGQGVGEGVVIKNYGWKNKWGNEVHAKLITNTFKEAHHREMGAPLIGSDVLEERIVEEFVTPHLAQKVLAKIVVEGAPFEKKDIPKLLGIVWHDLVTEELWEITKKYKNPTINFGLLNRLTLGKVKELLPEVFGR